MKRTIIQKIICLTVAILFLVNDICFGLGVQPGSTQPPTQAGMLKMAQGELPAGTLGPILDNAKSVFEGTAPQIEGIRFIPADYTHPPKGWENNPILQKTNLIEALEYFRDHEARIPKDRLTIREGYVPADETKGQHPIAMLVRVSRDGGRLEYEMIIDTRFVQSWNHVRKNDVWFETPMKKGELRTVSIAWGIFYRLAKHEMSDIARDTLQVKGGGHLFVKKRITSWVFNVDRDEESANRIGGAYRYFNDAIWAWFLKSYRYGDSTRYSNNKLQKELDEAQKSPMFRQEFPRLAAGAFPVKDVDDLTRAINYHFFSRPGIQVPVLTVNPAFITSYDNLQAGRKAAHIIETPMYAAGSGQSGTTSDANEWARALNKYLLAKQLPIILRFVIKTTKLNAEQIRAALEIMNKGSTNPIIIGKEPGREDDDMLMYQTPPSPKKIGKRSPTTLTQSGEARPQAPAIATPKLPVAENEVIGNEEDLLLSDFARRLVTEVTGYLIKDPSGHSLPIIAAKYGLRKNDTLELTSKNDNVRKAGFLELTTKGISILFPDGQGANYHYAALKALKNLTNPKFNELLAQAQPRGPGGRFGQEPGMSPETAMVIIAHKSAEERGLSEFTLQEYLEWYKKAKKSYLPSIAPLAEKYPGSTARRDLKALVKDGYLTIKNEGEKGKPYIYKVTKLLRRYGVARAKLERYGQADVLAYWGSLSPAEKEYLLSQIEQINWKEVAGLKNALIDNRRPQNVDFSGWEPAEPERLDPDKARAAGENLLRSGSNTTDKAEFGAILVSGGSASRFREYFPHTKGIFPLDPDTGSIKYEGDTAMPLSETTLFESTVKKLKALARRYGHTKMYPLIIMTSDVTHEETKAYFEKHGYFGEKDRIFIIQQKDLTLIIKETGKVLMEKRYKIALQGGGHGDAFDDIALRADVKKWLGAFGVKTLLYMNIDNPLYPMDVNWIGAHKLFVDDVHDGRRTLAPGLAIMSEGVVPKKGWDDKLSELLRLGAGRTPVHYSKAPAAVRRKTRWGMPSFRLIELPLDGTLPIPFSTVSKTWMDLSGKEVNVWKFERLSDDKAADGAIYPFIYDDTFASIKQPSGPGLNESPETSRRMQSEYWARKLKAAGFEVDEGLLIELPWDADFMEPAELKKALEHGRNMPERFSDAAPGGLKVKGYLIKDDWSCDVRLEPSPRVAAPAASPAKGTVLVTGGAGYIGSHTVRELMRDGYDVVVLDNLVKGREFSIKRNQDFAVRCGRKLIFEKGDLGNKKFLDDVLKRHQNIKKIIHFAAFIEVGESTERPALYYYNNIINTLHLLEAMTRHGVKRIIFSSSAATYGNAQRMPIDEGTPTNPINPYGFTKLMMEEMIQYYQKRFGIEWVALRYFNASGASQDGDIGESHSPESHLIPRVIGKFIKGEKPAIYGMNYKTRDKTCLRDYVSVEDLARAHVRALEGENVNRPYNLGTGVGFTVKEIISATAQILGVPAEYDIGNRRPGDPDALVASAAAFSAAFGWKPVASDIKTILQAAINWHRNRPREALEQKPLPNVDEADMAAKVERELGSNTVIPPELKLKILSRLESDMAAASPAAQVSKTASAPSTETGTPTPGVAEPASYLKMTLEQLKQEMARVEARLEKLEKESRALGREMKEVSGADNDTNRTKSASLEAQIAQLNNSLKMLGLEIDTRNGYSLGEGLGGGYEERENTPTEGQIDELRRLLSSVVIEAGGTKDYYIKGDTIDLTAYPSNGVGNRIVIFVETKADTTINLQNVRVKMIAVTTKEAVVSRFFNSNNQIVFDNVVKGEKYRFEVVSPGSDNTQPLAVIPTLVAEYSAAVLVKYVIRNGNRESMLPLIREELKRYPDKSAEFERLLAEANGPSTPAPETEVPTPGVENGQTEELITRFREDEKATAGHPLIQIISQWIIDVGRPKEQINMLPVRELKDIYQAIGLLYNTRIEILIPNSVGVSGKMKRAINDMNNNYRERVRKKGIEEKQDRINYRVYSGQGNLKQMLNEPPETGVQRIVITSEQFASEEARQEYIRGFGEDLAMFAGARLLNILMPEDYSGMKEDEQTFHQLRLIMIAIFARLVEENNDIGKLTLENMLRGYVDGDAKEFVNNLAKDENAWSVSERLNYFLGRTVSLLKKLIQEVDYLKLRMKTFYIAA